MKVRKFRSITEPMDELKQILEDSEEAKDSEEASYIIKTALTYGDYQSRGVCGLKDIAIPYEKFYQGNKYKKQTLAAISRKRG